MNKQEAIKFLQQLYPNGGHCWLDEQRIEAIGMAVKALQEEPVSEDLKKVYEKYVDHQIERIYPDLRPNLPRQSRMTLKVFDGTDIEIAFEAGAKWQKEQSEK